MEAVVEEWGLEEVDIVVVDVVEMVWNVEFVVAEVVAFEVVAFEVVAFEVVAFEVVACVRVKRLAVVEEIDVAVEEATMEVGLAAGCCELDDSVHSVGKDEMEVVE